MLSLSRIPSSDHPTMASEFDLYREAFQQHLHKSGKGKEPIRGGLPMDLAVLRNVGNRAREKFLERASLQPPQQLRLIDCKSTCEQEKVVLIDWRDEQVGYSAISHTYGMEVYKVFDCECTSTCLARVPRCSRKPCRQHLESSDPRNRVVKDVLNMCAILYWKAGVAYAWHDGVCIAQHDTTEVEETIKNIGWVYSYAMETIIFLHYIGRPMAPIRHDGDIESRWQTRVWTLQEAALSKHRRYCVRMGSELGVCQSLQEFEEKLALWYRDDCSEVAVIEEESYWKLLEELHSVLVPLCVQTTNSKAWRWCGCILDCMDTLRYTCFQFPSITMALEICSNRESKHEGDRINSILALAGVKDFVAPKDVGVENSTIEFFRRQGQQGLARAVFTANIMFNTMDMDGRFHTWVPNLLNPLKSVYETANMGTHLIHILSNGVNEGKIYTSLAEKYITFSVLDNGWIELRGELACVAVKFTVRSLAGRTDVQQESQQHEGSLVVLAKSEKPGLAMDLQLHIDGFKASLAQASSLDMGTAVVPILKEESLLEGECCKAASWRGVVRNLFWKAARAFLCIDDGEDDGASAATQQRLDNAVDALVSSGALARACSSMEESGSMAVVPSVSSTGVLAALTQGPSMDLGMPVLPLLSGRVNLRPLVRGREIQNGESFSAHLVFSVPALQRHQNHTPSSDMTARDWSVPALLLQGKLKYPVFKIGCFELNKQLKDVLAKLLPSLTITHNLVIR